MTEKRKEFSHCTRIEAIDLLASNFECFPENSELGDGRLNIAIKSDHDHFSVEEEHKYQVFFDIDVEGLNESEETVFQVKVRYCLVYDLEECGSNWKEEERDFFRERSSLMHLWPYLREHIDRLTSDSPAPRALLQLLPMPTNENDS
ncbi:hypothetical protein [Marinobacter algicola]|uniref:hypothetical protein n=1 Tax=Marinobacter algicola TaxID=236100 RepID=UPI003BA9DCB5